MYHTLYLGVLLCVAGSQALYDSSSDVVDLTPSNFDRLVTNSDEVWIVEFYAPWCGHCKNLVPEYKKAAKALKGIIKVGAVDADQHKSLSGKYGVTGFPTIKIFTGSKHTPYQGQRTADAFVDAGLKAAKDRAYDNLGRKSSGGSGDKRQVYGHNIPWKKIQRTIDRLGGKKITPIKEKQQLLQQQKLLSFRKPQVQQPLLSFRNPPVPKLRARTSEQQAPVIHKKKYLDKLYEQLFRSSDQQNGTSQIKKRIHKTLLGKSKNPTSKPQVTGSLKKMKLDNLHLFRDNLDSAGYPPKRMLRNNKLKVPNHLKKRGNSAKQFRNRKLTKQSKVRNKIVLKKKILRTEEK